MVGPEDREERLFFEAMRSMVRERVYNLPNITDDDIDDVAYQVFIALCGHCNLPLDVTEFPRALRHVAVTVAVDYFKKRHDLEESEESGIGNSPRKVQTISRGSTTISFADDSAGKSEESDLLSLILQKEPLWRRFRRARGVR